jgi:DNA-binding NarL/FixJ family response regulator
MIRILLADDQDLLCEILQTSLETEADLQIVGRANNGQVALEKIDRLHPDIVLLDINMPVMDGLTATEKIVHNFPETKVIVLSGSEDELLRANAIHAGAKSYIPKTAKASDIVEQIRLVYRENHFTESESQPELTATIMQLNQVKQEIQAYMKQIQLKLNQVDHTEAEMREHFGQLESKQGELSKEIVEFKSDVETILNDIRRTAKNSNYYSTEINRLQTLIEGQLSYIHNLNKRFSFLRKSLLAAFGIGGIALVISIINLILNLSSNQSSL